MSNTPFTPEQIEQLKRSLDPKRVKHRPGGGGTQLSYLEGHDAIDTANEIFGYGNWGYDLLTVDLNSVYNENGEIIGAYFSARVKLTVAGCIPITEEGVCPIQEGKNPRAKIDAHDMARKGAITDALKRALRCYGDQFGNSLYDRDLVDGQPRNNDNGYNRGPNRPTVPVQAAPSRPVAEPATRPARPVQPEPAPAPAATRPRTNGVATAEVHPVEEPSSEQQRTAIRKFAARKGMSSEELEAQLLSMYGCDVEGLSKADAAHFISWLNKPAA